MKKIIFCLFFAASLLLVSCSAGTAFTEVTDPESALRRLIEGNNSYRDNVTYSVNISPDRLSELDSEESPYAIIICPNDSRILPEAVFSLPLGNASIIKTPAAIIGDEELAYVEYAVENYDIKLILVLGSDDTTLIDDALSFNADMSVKAPYASFAATVKSIISPDSTLSLTRQAVEHTVDSILSLECVSTGISNGTLGVAGAEYSHEDGKITVYEDK